MAPLTGYSRGTGRGTHRYHLPVEIVMNVLFALDMRFTMSTAVHKHGDTMNRLQDIRYVGALDTRARAVL